MDRPRFLSPCAIRLALASALLLLPSAVARAQDVDWRTDYPTARREAAEKNRPLIVDFGFDTCVFCKKMDATTLRDPAIVSVINERFVPLRVDIHNDPHGLAQKLNIQLCPTLVFASSDGKILGQLAGFQESGPLQEGLQRVIGVTGTPDWMARDFQAAEQAITAADFTRALGLLRTIVDDNKERPIQMKARELIQTLEQQAASRLARAKKLASDGDTNEAMLTTTEVIRVFSGTQAAREASKMLNGFTAQVAAPATTPVAAPVSEPPSPGRSRRATDFLTQAKEDYRGQQFRVCLERCDVLTTHYPDLPEAVEAQRLAAEIRGNPEAMKKVCESLGEQLAASWMTLAESWLQKRQPEHAAIYLERILQSFPGTRQAEAAQVRLEQIKGQPTRPVEYQEPGKK